MLSSKIKLVAILAFSAFMAGCPVQDRARNYCTQLAMGNDPMDPIESRFDNFSCMAGVSIMAEQASTLGYTPEALSAAIAQCNERSTESSRSACRIGVRTLVDTARDEARREERRLREESSRPRRPSVPSSWDDGYEPGPRPGRRI
jgi:hypothetical protein